MDQRSASARKGRKYEQVVEGARKVFMHEGFEGASVDAIAKEAGVSKATLYSYFSDKEILFLEVAKSECLRQGEASEMLVTPGPVDEMLAEIARKMATFFLSDFGMRVFRVCVAESERFPELGRTFYQCGPERAKAKLVEFLKIQVDEGHLQITDCELAAEQFIELCKAHLFPRMIFSVVTKPSEEEIERVIKGAVEMFMARYGT
ncbi:TetR/AcrR family transcriptional regulator [Qingshengfaniella alkalisoli]|uniref:TetR/AcrR family transcriptional regulator n=1 Tax=Qingshengfaniella alkalisoli TaxID=2599296 RepID=A0A5B8I7J5_9RHOB|nr:TetR/AcrR family transcriptional regulator [Qingshengfaniella alkalisoli]QDY69775.1 TetR/AcrR family transcriptional regulator [Qingshengfaniella alkalisoli]